jgi:hypothetical protein
MTLFRRDVPMLASASQLTCPSKYFVPENAGCASISGPRTHDVLLPFLSRRRTLKRFTSIILKMSRILLLGTNPDSSWKHL